jgi:hypothetical protein
MTTLRIYDYRDGVLALDLSDLIDLLAPRSLEANWRATPVRVNDPNLGRFDDEFMISGPRLPGEDQLEVLAANGLPVSGVTFSEAAHAAHQVIWGQFVATLPKQNNVWVVIRAIDSTFYEVTTSDETALAKIKSAYKDVRVAPGPFASAPIPQVPREGGEHGRLPSWTHAKSIKVIDRADGKAKVYILARRDGFYEYRGEAEIRGDEYEGVYWSPTEISGIFASAHEAEQAAFDDVPWLRQEIRARVNPT